eukprot:12021138-Alexandrium_andersonii.AAC.1
MQLQAGRGQRNELAMKWLHHPQGPQPIRTCNTTARETIECVSRAATCKRAHACMRALGTASFYLAGRGLWRWRCAGLAQRPLRARSREANSLPWSLERRRCCGRQIRQGELQQAVLPQGLHRPLLREWHGG